MTDSATARFGARQQSQGSNTNTWGDDKLNEALRLLDRGSKGYQSYTMTGDTTLTWTTYVATNDGQCSVLVLAGSLSSAASLTVPSVQWQWDLIKNSTGQTITVKTAAGTGVAIPNGRQIPVYCDASDCYFGGPNYLGAAITLTGSRDLVDKAALETAIATASLPATAGTVLVSATDTTAGYLGSKILGSGAVSISITTPAGDEDVTISVGAGGYTDGGAQASSFTAIAGSSYSFPVGGTIALPAASGSRSKIQLSAYGAGVTALNGLVNGTNSSAAFYMDGDQTIEICDANSTRGWV